MLAVASCANAMLMVRKPRLPGTSRMMPGTRISPPGRLNTRANRFETAVTANAARKVAVGISPLASAGTSAQAFITP